MKQRFYLYKRGDRYYMQDARTGKQQALGTTDKGTALRLLEVKRQSVADPAYNQFILKSCLTTQDPLLPKRTWQTVMDQIQTHGKDSSRHRYARAMKAEAFDRLRGVKLVETTAEDFLSVLNGGKVSVAHYLRDVAPEQTKLALSPQALALLTDGVDLRGAKLRPWYEREN